MDRRLIITGALALVATCATCQYSAPYQRYSSPYAPPPGYRRYPTQTPPGYSPSRVRTTPRSEEAAEATPKPESGKPQRGDGEKGPAGSVIGGPITIRSAGAYRVATTLRAPAGLTTAVIVINAPDVTLDLSGNCISGEAATSPDACGIAILADRVTVRNGSISGFNRDNQCGVAVGGGAENFAIEDVRIGACESGIILNPENDESNPVQGGRISRLSVAGGSVGVLGFASRGVTIEHCNLTGCTSRRGMDGEGSAFLLRGVGYLVEGCNACGNGCGLRLDADFSEVLDTVASGNKVAGLELRGRGSAVRESTFSGNGGPGVVVTGSGCRVVDCAVDGNAGAGIALDSAQGLSAKNTQLLRCGVGSNGGDGVVSKSDGGAVIDGCHAGGNAGVGLNLKGGDVYRNCSLAETGGQASGGRDGGGNFGTQPAPQAQ